MRGLVLLDPGALLLLLAAVPVVAMYVLRARRRHVRVPSTWLWSSAQRELLARAPWRRLTPERSLLLELTAIAGIAVAAARPTWEVSARAGEHVAIVLDVSASMAARASAEPRIELARRAAHALLRGLRPGAGAMLVEAGRDARVVARLGSDHRALHAAIDRVHAQDVEGELARGIALAVDRLRPLGAGGRVVVITDRAVARGDPVHPRDVPIEVLPVGAPVDNAALVRLDVRTARAEGVQVVQVLALVANFASRARDLVVTARRAGAAAAASSRSVRVEAGRREAVTLVFPYAPGDAGAGLVVELSPHDHLAVDDLAFARIPPDPTLPVVIAAEVENPWLRRALEADPGVRLARGPVAAAFDAPEGALVIFDGACPSPLPDRDVLVLAPPAGPCAGLQVAAPVEAPEITSYASADPRLRFLTLDGVHLASASPLTLGPRASELLRAGDHVLLADAGIDGRSVTVAGIDVAASDWPLRASFVVFVRNVVERARAHRARSAAIGGGAGEPLRVAVPAHVRAATLQGPAGTEVLRALGGAVVVADTSRAGFYDLSWPGGHARAPVNLLSDAESDLRAPPWSLGPRAAPARGLAHTPPRELASWFALLAALALLANLGWRHPSAPGARPAPAAREVAP